MSRVIQDSDEELEEDLEVAVCQQDLIEAPPKQSTSNASSTEALRGQIAAAHRAHLQSQFSVVGTSQTPVTVDGHHQKRAVHVDFNSNSTSSGNFELEEVHVDYGKKSKGVFSNIPAGQVKDLSSSHQASEPASTTNGVAWMLEGSMREAYAKHIPNAMFPELSSTVPNATLTQQRVMEGVLAPALLGSDIDIERPSFQREASIPWSEYLKSSTNIEEQPRSIAQEPHISQSMLVALSKASPQELSGPLQPQWDSQTSSTFMESPSIHDNTPGTLDMQELSMLRNDEHHSNDKQTQVISLSTVNRDTHKQFSSIPGKMYRKISSPTPTSDNEGAGLRLPKEQYKPGPSRSRSLKSSTQESIDPLMVPEKAAKAIKRRKTTPATSYLNNLPTTPRKVQQIRDMGFTPSTSFRALKHNNGDITQSVDWLIANKTADDELVSHASQVSRTSRCRTAAHVAGQRKSESSQANYAHGRQMVATIAATDSDAMERDAASVQPDVNAHVDDNRSPAKVQVVIPTKSPRTSVGTLALPETSQKKAKRRKTTSDLPDPATKENSVPEEQVQKKRDRCCSKKRVNKALLSTSNIHNDDKEVLQTQMHNSLLQTVNKKAHSTPVQDKAIKHKAPATVVRSDQDANTSRSGYTTSATATPRTTPEPSALPDRPEVEPITPEPIKKSAPRVQPSTNKRKIPYRVGLSKRARIAPLLRVVKK